ncbi:MAG: cold shock domain-containing protein, partial [Anaerolineales bacterium]|nr:cold shock domain-containing protein [Anaerolineales bacterium]
GYGFIARGAGEDIFFHRSDFIGDPETLAEGSWLLYDVEETQKGLEASEIEPYQGDPSQLF